MPALPPVKTLPSVATARPSASASASATPLSAAVAAASSSLRSVPNLFFARTRLTLLPSVLLIGAILVTTLSFSPSFRATSLRQPFLTGSAAADPVAAAAPPPASRASLQAWVDYLRSTSATQDIRSSRVACREMEAGAQTCVFEGLMCMNVSAGVLPTARPLVYLVDDAKNESQVVPSDNWCSLRHISSDPRYFSSRHWPILADTVAPQQSCLNARYRSADALLAAAPDTQVRWEPDGLSLVDLDYSDNPHNNHMLKDILWLLDTALFQDSLQLQPRPGYPTAPADDSRAHIFKPDAKIYLPQSRRDFEKQTSRDVNRLTYSTVLRRNLTQLYPTLNASDLHTPAQTRRLAVPMLQAYPELASQLVFHRDLIAQNGTELVCTPRLTVGAKIGNGAHERVCRYLRNQSYELYGIRVPERTRLGQIFYPQPPKRVMILQRHVTRKIANLDALYTALRTSLEPHKIAVEVVMTSELRSAEDHVRIFSRAGVLLSAHGSQNMGQIWMPRHSSLIEIMPVGYTDYAFNLLSDSCRLWYYELQSLPHPNKTDEFYMEKCGRLKPHMMNPCVQVKSMDVVANISDTVRTVRFALERMGFSLEPWMEFVRHG